MNKIETNKKILAFLFFAVFLIWTSCEKPPSCLEEYSLFDAHDSIPRIQIEKGDTRELLIEKIENTFGEDICFKNIEFGLQLSEKVVKCNFQLYCPLKTSRIPPTLGMNVLINADGEVLINNEILIEVDSFKSWIVENYELAHTEELTNKDVKILWNIWTPVKNLEVAILEIVKGLNIKYNQLSTTKYKKDLCALNKKEVSVLLNEFPVNIIFDVGNPPPPPPPPPIK